MAAHWETGERHPVRWRVVAVVAAVAMVVGLGVLLRGNRGLEVSTGEDELVVEPSPVDVVAQPPAAAGDRWLCPRSLSFRAYDDGTYYPRGHPAAPSFDERPANCYREAEAAEAAGYQLAEPPPDTGVVFGVYVQPTSMFLRGTCGAVAERLDFAIPCPGALPFPADNVRCNAARCDYERGFVLDQRGFPVPTDWGADANLALTASPRDRPGARELLTCVGETIARGLPDRPGRLVRHCPQGPPWIPDSGGYPHEGHTMTQWERAGVVYALSVEGDGRQQLALTLALARRLAYSDNVPLG
ncbi:MAG: hypothetical protein ACRDU8_06005 [Egibacteraceae bacterium]